MAELLTEKEAAELLRVSRESLRKWRAQGRIGFVRVGRAALYRAAHLDAFLQAHEHAPQRFGR